MYICRKYYHLLIQQIVLTPEFDYSSGYVGIDDISLSGDCVITEIKPFDQFVNTPKHSHRDSNCDQFLCNDLCLDLRKVTADLHFIDNYNS